MIKNYFFESWFSQVPHDTSQQKQFRTSHGFFLSATITIKGFLVPLTKTAQSSWFWQVYGSVIQQTERSVKNQLLFPGGREVWIPYLVFIVFLVQV